VEFFNLILELSPLSKSSVFYSGTQGPFLEGVVSGATLPYTKSDQAESPSLSRPAYGYLTLHGQGRRGIGPTAQHKNYPGRSRVLSLSRVHTQGIVKATHR